MEKILNAKGLLEDPTKETLYYFLKSFLIQDLLYNGIIIAEDNSTYL